MSRSKKIFVALVVLFVLLLAYASYDISSRTTFPGSKPQLQERLKKNYLPGDTATDSSVERTDTIPGKN
jgi:hypothetical protein